MQVNIGIKYNKNEYQLAYIVYNMFWDESKIYKSVDSYFQRWTDKNKTKKPYLNFIPNN